MSDVTKTKTWVCHRVHLNSRMGSNECHDENGSIFYFDASGTIKPGDRVKCERGMNGFYLRVWVNDELIYTRND